MRILICSDGTDPADKPARLGGLIAGPAKATVDLLGIAERNAMVGKSVCFAICFGRGMNWMMSALMRKPPI